MVFISYSTKDSVLADQLREVLETNGIKCWMAPRDIAPGLDYGIAIPQAIVQAKVFVLLLTENSQASIWCTKELDLAISNGTIVIPFHADSSMLAIQFNFRLTNVQRIEAYERLEAAYSELVNFVRTIDADDLFEPRTQADGGTIGVGPQTEPSSSRSSKRRRAQASGHLGVKKPNGAKASGGSNGQGGAIPSEERVSDVVKGRLIPLLEQDKVSEEEVLRLQSLSYSKEVFGLRRPALKKLGPTENASVAAKDAKGHGRFYVKPVMIRGERYLVCSQWYRDNKPPLEQWLALQEEAVASRGVKPSGNANDQGSSEFPEKRVSDVVKGRLIPLLEQGKVSEEEVRRLQDAAYSKETFKLRLPLLKKIDPSENPAIAAKDAKGIGRYYVKPVQVRGDLYLVCSQWYTRNRPLLETWVLRYESTNA